VEGVSGSIGGFTIRVRKKARYVDTAKCTGCGACWSSCPATRIPAGRKILFGGMLVNERSGPGGNGHDA
jgi:ferredoxin